MIQQREQATPLAVRSFEYWLLQYKRTWRSTLVSSFLNPLLFLAAMGLGLGSLVDKTGSSAGALGGVDYLVFLAPGLMASTAMQVAAAESTYPVWASIKWIRTYYAMLATPIRVIDVLVGHLLYIAMRLVITCTVYLGVMAMFGAAQSWSALLAVPAAVLTGMAFCTPIVAFAARVNNDGAFPALFRFGIVPLFLFSGTFFPVSQLPAGLRPVAYATPLWHGVDLCRTLALGTETLAGTAGHLAYLLALAGLGLWLADRSFTRRLII